MFLIATLHRVDSNRQYKKTIKKTMRKPIVVS